MPEFTTPVAFFIFNRPKPTRRVFEEIRKAAPGRLFVIADGPREDRAEEEAHCAETRAVIEQVDWPCRVSRNFSDQNLGVGRRVSSGLDWVFQQVEQAIVLEDDCLPEQSFFPFCQTLLERYRERDDVMMISGTNDLLSWKASEQSYGFGLLGSIWGWATWRRAWRHYDFHLSNWPSKRERERLTEVLRDPAMVNFRASRLDLVAGGEVDTWDYQWSHARVLRGGLCATPARNLISNIGFGPLATHTINSRNLSANMPRRPLSRPFRSPNPPCLDRDFDRILFRWQIQQPSLALVANRVETLVQWGESVRALQLIDGYKATVGRELETDQLGRLFTLRAEVLEKLGKAKYAQQEMARARSVAANVIEGAEG